MRSRGRKNVTREGRRRGNLRPRMYEDGDRDPHRSTGLSPQDPIEEQKDAEHKKGSQDSEGGVHPMIQGD